MSACTVGLGVGDGEAGDGDAEPVGLGETSLEALGDGSG
jgi:hypothetical protein